MVSIFGYVVRDTGPRSLTHTVSSMRQRESIAAPDPLGSLSGAPGRRRSTAPPPRSPIKELPAPDVWLLPEGDTFP
jgi:hypothetical protein